MRDIYKTCNFFDVKNKEKVPKPCNFGTFSGGDNRTRICDLPRVRRTLYQLSYASILSTPFGDMTYGDPYGTRTRVTAVKGRCLNHLTNGPCDPQNIRFRGVVPKG